MRNIPANKSSSGEIPIKKKPAWRSVMPWLAVGAWAALIFYLSAQPSLKTDMGTWDFILRKGAHMAEFAVLCLLLWNAFRQTGIAYVTALLPSAAVALAYAFSDEFHQKFVPGRTSALRDVGFDAAGIAIMSLFIFMRRRKSTERVDTMVS